jgi:hypothetical protein
MRRRIHEYEEDTLISGMVQEHPVGHKRFFSFYLRFGGGRRLGR